MASTQYQLPTGEFVNVEDNGDEYQLPVAAFFIEEAAAAPTGVSMAAFTPLPQRIVRIKHV